MSHNAYVRVAGTWNTMSDLHASEMALFDLAQFKALNADDGGTWAPAAIITIGGAGCFLAASNTIGTSSADFLTVNATTTFNALTICSAPVQFQATIAVTGSSNFVGIINAVAANFSGALVATAGATVTGGILGDTLGISGNVALGTSGSNTLTINSAASFAASATVAHNATVGSTSADTLESFASALFHAPVTINGGAVWRDVIGTNASRTYAMTGTDTVIVPPSTITSSLNYTIDITGAQTGMRIAFANYDSTNTVTLLGPISGGGGFPLLNATGHNVAVEFTLIGGTLYPRMRFAI
jgi:hypothetical protein